MANRKGNPAWGKPGFSAPKIQTKFEKEAEKLGVPESMWQFDSRLRNWAEKNCNRFWVPLHLIVAWGLEREAERVSLGGSPYAKV